MPEVKDFKELDVWKTARELVKETYLICRTLPKDEAYCLSDQMRRAAISVPSNIAEGWGRSGDSDYPHFLSIALGSLYELQTQIILCRDIGYTDEESSRNALDLCDRISRMLNRLIFRLKK